MGWGSILAPLAGGIGMDLIGMNADKKAAQYAATKNQEEGDRNRQMQELFAKMGITWRVEDARNAGIHPLAALGASGANYSPVMTHNEADYSRGNAFRSMGQRLDRAVAATQNADQRLESRYRLENMRMQNELLDLQLKGARQPNNPPMPVGGSDNFMGGQGDSGIMLVTPSTRVSHAPGRPAQEAGSRPDVAYSRTDTGLVPVIPQGLSESLEDDLVGQILWRIRNQIVPNLSGRTGSPPKSQLPPGADHWRWDRLTQEWQPAFGGRRSFGREVYEKFRYGR